MSELLSIAIGFVIALLISIGAGKSLDTPVGCVFFFIFWAIASVVSAILIVFVGVIAKWIFIGIAVLLVFSLIGRKK